MKKDRDVELEAYQMTERQMIAAKHPSPGHRGEKEPIRGSVLQRIG